MSSTALDRGGLERAPQRTGLGDLVKPGRLTEISGAALSARLTTAVAIVRAAQLEGETAAWIQPVGGPLFPPDLAESGIDLDSLVVVHIPTERGRAGIARAAELLLSSGAFGLCVLDLSAPRSLDAAGPDLPGTAWQARLASIARTHDSRVVLLTCGSAERDSLGPMIGARLQPRRKRQGPGIFQVHLHVLKNKGAALDELPVELSQYSGPWGLR